MRIPRIYITQPLQGIEGLELAKEAVRHIQQVLRLKVGAPLVLFDGLGGEYAARIIAAEKRKVVVEVLEHRPAECESGLSIHLFQGLSRGERMDFVMQKSVELGVAAISPVISERCGVSLSAERQAKRLTHWRSVIVSACEQCGRNRLPVLNEIESLSSCLASSSAGLGLVLDPEATRSLAEMEPPATGKVSILIGPEGGLSQAELALAEQAGFIRVSLGRRVLRTETAALAALAALQVIWGDLGGRGQTWPNI